MKRLVNFSLLLLLIVGSIAYGQSTTVTATVVDQASVKWANGTWKLDLIPNPQSNNGVLTWNGSPLPQTQWHYAGALDNNGYFTQSVPSNSKIAPSGSTYTVTVCPNASAPCSVIQNLSFQGGTSDISSTITSMTASPSVQPLPLARAYNDSEVAVNPTLVGYFYQNVSTNQPRYWNGSVWSNFNQGLSSISVGSLSPLFTSSVNNLDPSNPTISYAPQSAAANTVYGNCTNSGGNPTFCAITAAMLPTNLTSSTSGYAGGLTNANNCGTSPQGFMKGINPNGSSNCQQVAFSNLGGNIQVSQMNAGFNANSTTVWTGNGTWQPFPTQTGVRVVDSKTLNSTALCTTAASSYAQCINNINWPNGNISGAYMPVCYVTGPSDARALWAITSVAINGITITFTTQGSVAVTYNQIVCEALQ